jgi:hypothetical protein
MMGLQCYHSYPQDSQEEYPVNVWFPPSNHYEAHIDNDSKVDAGIIGGHDIRQRLGHAQDVGKEVLHPEIGRAVMIRSGRSKSYIMPY